MAGAASGIDENLPQAILAVAPTMHPAPVESVRRFR